MTDYLLIPHGLHPASRREKNQNTAAKSTGAIRGTILTNAKKEKIKAPTIRGTINVPT
jgi:hypothetical protein